MKKALRMLVLTSAALSLLAAAGCGGSSNQNAANSSQAASSPPPAKASATTGSIKIESTPPGASIILIAEEGGEVGRPQSRGATPATVTDVAPGQYTIHLEKTGYKPFQKSVEVKANETVSVTASLKK